MISDWKRGRATSRFGGLGLGLPGIPMLLEGCWLALAAVSPALFNPASLRVFEPEKVAFVRALALLMVALSLAEGCRAALSSGDETVESPGPRSARFGGDPGLPALLHRWNRIPFLLPMAALMAAYLLSALLSEMPQTSLLGSYRRQFGAATQISYAAVFLVVATHLRTPGQMRRLILALALGSLAPSAYAVAQRLGLDPVHWSMDHSRRVVGSLGQPTFLGAYLAAALPDSLLLFRGTRSQRGRLGVSTLVALQLAALLFSQSRAAWAGAAIGAGISILGYSGRGLRTRAGLQRLALAGVAGLTLLAALNLPGSEIHRVARTVPYLERAASLGNLDEGSGRVRTLIWQTAPSLVAERPILGHGPEMMGYAFERHYPPELAYAESRTASADSAHNLFLQLLVATGLVGLAAYLWLLGSLAHSIVAWLRRESGAQSGVEGHAWDACLSTGWHAQNARIGMMATAVAGIVAGLVEGLAGVPSAAPYLLFWLYLALVASLLRGAGSAASESWDKRQARRTEWRKDARHLPAAPSRWLRSATTLLLLALAGFGILRLSLQPILADVAASAATSLASLGRFEEAAQRYRHALQLSPEAEYHLLLGQMAVQAAERSAGVEAQGWLRQGEEALGEAERLAPLELDVALSQGKLHQLKARLLGSQAEWGRAEEAYRRALALSPNRSYVRNRYGALLADQGRHQEALAQYRISERLDPRYAATYGFMGDSLVALRQTADAVDAYERAKHLDPNLVLVRINLGELYARLGRLQEAIVEYDQAAALSPSDQGLRLRLEQLRSAVRRS